MPRCSCRQNFRLITYRRGCGGSGFCGRCVHSQRSRRFRLNASPQRARLSRHSSTKPFSVNCERQFLRGTELTRSVPRFRRFRSQHGCRLRCGLPECKRWCCYRTWSTRNRCRSRCSLPDRCRHKHRRFAKESTGSPSRNQRARSVSWPIR